MAMQNFHIQIEDAAIRDLQQRLAHTRWPHETITEGWKKGVPAVYLKNLTDYWQQEFDWRKQEALLNQYPQYITVIDQQPVHFLHIPSPHPNAIPLMLIHGWPGSFADFTRIIEPLTQPGTQQSENSIAFHLVIPSIPGFGFSIPVKEKGWNMIRIAAAFTTLMQRLGYEKFAVHGGDMGAGIAGIMSGMAAYRLIGTHVNTDFYSVAGLGMFPEDTSFFTEEEKGRLEAMKQYKKNGTGYLEIQSTRPQTIGYALTDSPVGQLAWMIEKYQEWTGNATSLPEEAIDIDHLLTNVSLYWFNKLGASTAEMLYENMSMAFDWGSDTGSAETAQYTPPKVPSAMAAFGKQEDESLLKKLLSFMGASDRWTFYHQAGHFPAMEAPEILVKDLQEFFSGISNR